MTDEPGESELDTEDVVVAVPEAVTVAVAESVEEADVGTVAVDKDEAVEDAESVAVTEPEGEVIGVAVLFTPV